MKKLIFTLAMLLYFSSLIWAQTSFSSNTAHTTRIGGLRLIIGLQNESLSMVDGYVNGWIVDDSPSQDWLEVGAQLESTKRATGLHLGLQFDYPNQLSWNADISFSGNQEGRVFTGNLGAGYRLEGDRIQVIPMARVGLGNGNFKLGQLFNEASYIQIDDTQFYDDQISVRLKDLYAYVAPELNVFYALNDHMGIQLTAGYKFTGNRPSQIQFSGYTDTSRSTTATAYRELSHPRNDLALDDLRLSNRVKMVALDGLYLRASFVILFILS